MQSTQVIGKKHRTIAIVLLVLFGLLIFFQRKIILNTNATPLFLSLLYIVAGLLLMGLVVNYYKVAVHRIRPPYYKTAFLDAPHYYYLLLFLVLIAGIQLVTAWLQTKGLLGTFDLQQAMAQQSGVNLWAVRIFMVAFLPAIQQGLFNGLAFNELFVGHSLGQYFGGLVLVAILSGLFAGTTFGPMLIIQILIGVLLGLSYLSARNLTTPILIQTISSLIFVLLYS